MVIASSTFIRAWKWWFIPRSTDPTVVYRERALRVLVPVVILLRALGLFRNYSSDSTLPALFAPLPVNLAVFIIPVLLSIYFLTRQRVDWAGACFLLHWYLTDMLSLPAEGYWYPNYQISLIIQVVLGTLLLSSRAILPFMIFQLTTVGMWGSWLDINYYDPPLLSSGLPVTTFWITFASLAAQESIILFIVRYLRQQMEKALHLQQTSIQQLEAEVVERKHIEARLRGVFENSPDLVLELDRAGTILLANRHAEQYEGKKVYPFILPEYSELAAETIVQAFETGKNISAELQTKEKDGSFQWNSIRVGPVLSGGQVASLVAIVTNIHAQKQVALQVKQRAEQLATIVEIGHAVSTLQDLYSVLEIVYKQIQHIAPADAFFICLYDESSNRLSFPLTYDLGIRYDQSDSFLTPDIPLAHVIKNGQPFRLHRTPERMAEIEKEDGDVGNSKLRSKSLLFVPLWQANRVIGALSIQTYSYNAYSDELVETITGVGHQVAIAIQNSRLFTSVQQELAERKRAEMKQEKLIQELEQRNAELERLAYTLSHELKSPLITIRGFLGYLQEDALSGNIKRLKGDIQRITDGAEKMLRLINELIELMGVGRIQRELEEISLSVIVGDAVNLVDDKIRGKNIAIRVADDLPDVYGDRKRLVEVFQNLLENSIKFMGEQPEPMIEIGLRTDHNALPIFYVRDNGIGIEPRFADRIFGIFHKLDMMSEGTGIGLALVKRIIEVHGGKIWVESIGPGRGSTFCFTIPDGRKQNMIDPGKYRD